jgi:hypothetical protein
MANWQTGILGCCGLQGFAKVGDYVNKIDEHYNSIPDSADSWFKERIVKCISTFNRGTYTKTDVKNFKFMCAGILISVALRSEQKLAKHLLDLGFTELKVGNNRNTRSDISLFSMDVEKFEPMFKEWALEFIQPVEKKEPAKKVNPFLAFDKVTVSTRDYTRDAQGRFA